VAIPRYPARSVLLSDLGFLEDPFPWAPDPRYLFLSSQHRPILNQLHRIIERERGLAIVDGEHGTGKSTIARRLESYYGSRPDEYCVAFIHRPTFDSRYSTLLGLSHGFSLLRRKGIDHQWSELAEHLHSEREEGRIPVILLDDAHNIKPEAFVELDHVAQELAAIVAFGLPEVQIVLAHAPEVLARSTRATLLPFSLYDAVELIKFRTWIAGRKEPMFGREAIEYIWEATRGNPKDMIIVCGRVINELGSRGQSFVTADIAKVAVESYLSSPLSVFRPEASASTSGPTPEVEQPGDPF